MSGNVMERGALGDGYDLELGGSAVSWTSSTESIRHPKSTLRVVLY